MIAARYAEVSDTGGVHMVSADIDILKVDSVPAMISIPIYLVVRVAVPPEQSGKTYECRVDFAGPGGLLESATHISEVNPSENGRDAKITIVTTMGGFPLPETGRYLFKFFIDNKELETLPIHVELKGGPA